MRDIESVRMTLLEASLPHVALDGWSEAALAAGARDADLSPAEILDAFPNGPREALTFWSELLDRQTMALLESEPLEEMRVRDKVTLGVRRRLELLAPHREAARRGLTFLAMPQNAPLAARLLWRTVDAIWYAAGDTATDYNFYSKRSLLLGVYSATFVFWLDDHSPGHRATWAFLDRRVEEVMRVGGWLGKSVGRLLALPEEFLKRRGARRGFGPRP